MRTGAKKSPSYRVVVKEKQSKRDGAYLENVGTYNPTRKPAEIKLNLSRVNYWIEKGAQPTDTVSRLIKASTRAEAATAEG
jgi:small subunit ribosomal protein S16